VVSQPERTSNHPAGTGLSGLASVIGMRILLTGGAGFIGTRVATRLAEAGHDVLRLDSLHRPAAHGTPPAPPQDPALLVGDVRDADTVAAALRGVDAVVHHAAMVGMGLDLADLPEYAGCNDLGTAVLLAQMARARVGMLVLASSMVVYGEGAYDCPEHGAVRPEARDGSDLAAGRFEPRCPDCGRPLAPGLVDESAPMDHTGEFRTGDVRHVVASPRRAREELGFQARVPFADGMAAFATVPLRG
jgi:dTDP-L-rhamnose 4-epimerase